MTLLQRILELPFEEYMNECWAHARRCAQESPLAAMLYSDMLTAHRYDTEAMWAVLLPQAGSLRCDQLIETLKRMVQV